VISLVNGPKEVTKTDFLILLENIGWFIDHRIFSFPFQQYGK